MFRITIPLDKVATDEGREQKTLSEREQKIYNMICENLHLSVEQVMAELDISRATVFRDYAKIKIKWQKCDKIGIFSKSKRKSVSS